MTTTFKSAVKLARTKIEKSFLYTGEEKIRLLSEAIHCLLAIEYASVAIQAIDKEFVIHEALLKDFQMPNIEAS